MGQTAEILAKEWNISRLEQDQFALASHQKAVASTKSGRLGEEITPVPESAPETFLEPDQIAALAPQTDDSEEATP